MKKNLLLYVLPLIIILSLTFHAYSQLDYDKEQLLNQFIFNSLKIWHYKPQVVNDELSKKSFKLLLKKIDSGKKFLLKQDVKILQAFETKIDDDIKQNAFKTMDFAIKLLRKRIKFVQSIYQELLSKPFDFEKEEYIETDFEKRNFSASDSEMKEFWRKLLKYQTLYKYKEIVLERIKKEDKEKNKKKTSDREIEEIPDFLPAIEKEARNKVKKSIRRQLKRLLDIKEKEYMAMFLNSVLNCYDPHTMYFLPKSKEDFDIDLTGSLEGIGASLTEKDGFIKVVEIIPGSACWRQGELQAEDIILKVAQGDGEAVDIVEMPVRDAVKLIRGKKGTEVRLTVKKPDGRIMIIPIIRDVVIIEEVYAKAMVLKHRDSEVRYGYIKLPKFYHDFQKRGTKNSFSDIRNKLEKLKKKMVSGVILDLRNNSGGSLHEAVKTSGLFIDKGPVVQVRKKDKEPTILRDNDGSVSFKGPLVVIVNSFSASASEILAGALQDYDRAVIVGTEHTFGKGTVQTFVNLDRFLPPRYTAYKPMGSFKLTIQKFYRINGDATQYKGVIPDVVLPDPFGYIDVGEKKHDHSLPWDSISPLDYNIMKSNTGVFKTVIEKSRKRVGKNALFKKLRKYIVKMKKRSDDTKQTLNFSGFMKESIEIRKDSEQMKNLQPESRYIDITQIDKPKNKNNSEKYRKRQKEMLDSLKKDFYIYEGLAIIDDINEEIGQ